MNAKILVTGVAVAVLSAGLAAAQTNSSASSMGASSSTGGAAAASTTTAGSPAKATTHKAHHRRMASNERRSKHNQYAAPEQPIPYAMLDQYMKASPRERTAMLQRANTGTTADVSATAPAAPSAGSNMGAAGSDNTNSMPPQSSTGSPNTASPAPMTGSPNQPSTMGQGQPGAAPAATPNTPPPNPPQ